MGGGHASRVGHGLGAVRKGSANPRVGSSPGQSPLAGRASLTTGGGGGRGLEDFGVGGGLADDPEFAGLSKNELASKVHRAEELLHRYANENARLSSENDSLRGSKQLLEMEHRGVMNDNEELAARLASLEYSFLNQQDGTADAFGFDDEASTVALTSGFPDFPGVGKSTIKRALLGGTSKEGRKTERNKDQYEARESNGGDASGGDGSVVGAGRGSGARKPRAAVRGMPPPR